MNTSRHTIEIPLASDGSAKLTLRGDTIEELLIDLANAAASIEKIIESAGRIVVACCTPAPRAGGQP